MSEEPTMYRRVRPEDKARMEEQQRQRCAGCGGNCAKPLPHCAGHASWKEIFIVLAPTISVMLMCGGIALLTGLIFQAAPK